MVALLMVAIAGARMDIPEKIAGFERRQICELFKTFTEQESDLAWEAGVPKLTVRQMTISFICDSLGLQHDHANLVQAALIDEGWIDKDKLTPTRSGMALAQHVDRPKISQAEAEAILNRVLKWAERTNATSDARVKVKTIFLFGSLNRGAAWVDDIDIFVEFTTMDLGDDLQPEDMEREDELCEELASISERISQSSEIDRMIMDDVEMRQVFPQDN